MSVCVLHSCATALTRRARQANRTLRLVHWNTCGDLVPEIVLPLVTIHPYEYSFSQAGRLTVTYNTRYPLPLTSAQEAAREADFQRIEQTYLSFTRYSRVVEHLANLFLDNPRFYVEADPSLPLARRRTFRTSCLRPTRPRGAPYSRYHPY